MGQGLLGVAAAVQHQGVGVGVVQASPERPQQRRLAHPRGGLQAHHLGTAVGVDAVGGAHELGQLLGAPDEGHLGQGGGRHGQAETATDLGVAGAVFGPRLEQVDDEGAQCCGHPGDDVTRGGWGLATAPLDEGQPRSGQWGDPGEQLIEDQAEREPVRGRPHRRVQALGRHVAGGAHHQRADVRARGDQPEVEDDRCAIGLQDDVAWLEIAVQVAGAVEVLEGFGEASCDGKHRVGGHPFQGDCGGARGWVGGQWRGKPLVGHRRVVVEGATSQVRHGCAGVRSSVEVRHRRDGDRHGGFRVELEGPGTRLQQGRVRLGDGQRGGGGDRHTWGTPLPQALPIDHVHQQKPLVLGGPQAVVGHEAGVAKISEQSELSLEPDDPAPAGFPQHLEGQPLVGGRVDHLIDIAARSAAEPTHHAEPAGLNLGVWLEQGQVRRGRPRALAPNRQLKGPTEARAADRQVPEVKRGS